MIALIRHEKDKVKNSVTNVKQKRNKSPGIRFPKVLKLFGPHNFLCISRTERGLKSPNFTAIQFFCYLENIPKDHLFKASGSQFPKWLFGPEKGSGHSGNGTRRCST